MEKSAKLKDKLLKRTITQDELEGVERQRTIVADLKRALKMAEADLANRELDVSTRLTNGARVTGRLTAVIEKRPGPCRPQWKTEMVTHMEECHHVAPEVTEAVVQARWPGQPHEILVIVLKNGPKAVKE